MSLSIVCPACKDLIPVVAKTIAVAVLFKLPPPRSELN